MKNPIIARKLRLLAELSLIAVGSGILYQLVRDGTVDYRAFLMGALIGMAFGVIEHFVARGFRKQVQGLPLLVTIVVKAVVYLFIITVVSGLLGLTIGYFQGKHIEEFYSSMLSKNQLILTVYSLILYLALSFYIQINLLLGDGVLLKFLFGKYRKPTNESRIFMFLDLKSSTTIAEKLGHNRYYSFLNDFFHEITEPALSTHAEIYQYVGDEVVFTWKTNEGLADDNGVKIFFKIQDRVRKHRTHYRDKYGFAPEFKAGLHFGDVISAQIGDIKREIVYNGDVLNTSARIQEQCNVVQRELLISGNLLHRLDLGGEYQAVKVDTVTLRGKNNPLELFSLMRN